MEEAREADHDHKASKGGRLALGGGRSKAPLSRRWHLRNFEVLGGRRKQRQDNQ